MTDSVDDNYIMMIDECILDVLVCTKAQIRGSRCTRSRGRFRATCADVQGTGLYWTPSNLSPQMLTNTMRKLRYFTRRFKFSELTLRSQDYGKFIIGTCMNSEGKHREDLIKSM